MLDNTHSANVEGSFSLKRVMVSLDFGTTQRGASLFSRIGGAFICIRAEFSGTSA